MTSFKTLAILILGFAFLQATLASSHCQAQLFKYSLDDKDQDTTWIWLFQDVPPYYNAPFEGLSGPVYGENLEQRTISSFRAIAIDLDQCGPCTVAGYSGKDLSGKKSEHYVDWSYDSGRVNFDFCVKSFTLQCEANHVEEEEREEEEEEEREE